MGAVAPTDEKQAMAREVGLWAGRRVGLRLIVVALVLLGIVVSFVHQFALAFAGLGSFMPFVGWLVALVASVALGLRPRLMTGLLAAAAAAEFGLLVLGLMLQAPPGELSDCATVEETGVAGVSDWYWATGIAVGVAVLVVMLVGVARIGSSRGVAVLAIGGGLLTAATYVFLTEAVTRIEAAELTLTDRADCGSSVFPGWQAVTVALFAAATVVAGWYVHTGGSSREGKVALGRSRQSGQRVP